jgi:hypothetical protein
MRHAHRPGRPHRLLEKIGAGMIGLGRGRIDWGGEGLIGAGFIAINPAQTFSAGRSTPLAGHDGRGRTGAAAVRDVWVRPSIHFIR